MGALRAMRYGYARSSTADQNPALQLGALKRAACKRVFTGEGVSGMIAKRPELTRRPETLQAGDTLIVWKLDRSVRDLIALLDDLKASELKFRPLTESIDTETGAGTAMWQLIGVLAQLERSKIAERTRAGLPAAHVRGAPLGRKPK